MEYKFLGTKGEWVANGNSVLCDNKVLSIAYLMDLKHDRSGRTIKDESAEHNAMLIAAAPELLQACIEMIKWHDGDEGMQAITDIEPLMRKAIHKALNLS